MCAICGLFRPDGTSVSPARAARMRDAMVPRGPDDAGLSSGPGFALGHRRLAIIDLTEAGHQPMASEDGLVQLVFNGEIYNFQELRPELEAAGHAFRSRSDTEVLLHGYEEWGLEALLRRIRGMYAFALVDRRHGTIHLARDPLGKKPLFFRYQGGELAFASSARALARGLERTPEVDPAAVDDLLWNLYIPGPRTIFAGVEKLPPGQAISIGRDGQRRDLVHWRPDFLHPDDPGSDEELIDRVEATLQRAVQRRLEADVPLGVLLSGGVDSSLVTALAARQDARVKTFTVATEDRTLDESPYARAVAERYDTEHHVLPVRSNVRQDLTTLVAGMGEPLADASAANLFAIARVAREHVTVVLTGDGGDEVFGGYGYFWAYHHAGRLRRFLPRPLRAPLSTAGRFLRRGRGTARRAGTLLRLAAAPVEETLYEDGWMGPAVRDGLYTPQFSARLGSHSPREHYCRAAGGANGAAPVDRVMQAHARTVLPDEYLAKVDGATMAASLEARSPLLDLELVELGMRLPAATRFRGEPKAVLRQLARRHLPAAGVDRRKQGFVAPVGRWLREEWNDLVEEMILGPQVEARGWFRRPALEQVVADHRQGRDRAYLLWGLLVLELWWRLTVERSLLPGDAV